MKKTERHLLIQQMIRNEKLSTQKEIQDRLEAKGIAVTQTTLSRDLRDLGLVKVKRKDQLYYILPNSIHRLFCIIHLVLHCDIFLIILLVHYIKILDK